MSTKPIIISISIASFIILKQVISNLPESYMDEKFHINQTVNYYNGDIFNWDEKLTTFPLMFIITAILRRIFWFFSLPLLEYRYISYIMSCLLLIKVSQTSEMIFNRSNFRFSLLIYLLPINFFYYFLFYTDTLSTYFVTSYFFYELFLRNNLQKTRNFDYKRLLLMSLSILSRQNNIIWVNFFNLLEVIFSFPQLTTSKVIEIIRKYKEIVIIDVLFILFLVFNNFSVVLGDASNHKLCFHLSQITHFICFLYIFFPSLILSMLDFYLNRLKRLKKQELTQFFQVFITCIIVLYISETYFLYSHSFIESDNRHFSFYFFKKIIKNPVFNKLRQAFLILILPQYVYDFIVNDSWVNKKYFLSYYVCLVLILVPVQLFEFRYFALPLTLFIIISFYTNSIISKRLLVTENILFALAVNCVSLYVFLFRPFENESFHEISRFMW